MALGKRLGTRGPAKPPDHYHPCSFANAEDQPVGPSLSCSRARGGRRMRAAAGTVPVKHGAFLWGSSDARVHAPDQTSPPFGARVDIMDVVASINNAKMRRRNPVGHPPCWSGDHRIRPLSRSPILRPSAHDAARYVIGGQADVTGRRAVTAGGRCGIVLTVLAAPAAQAVRDVNSWVLRATTTTAAWSGSSLRAAARGVQRSPSARPGAGGSSSVSVHLGAGWNSGNAEHGVPGNLELASGRMVNRRSCRADGLARLQTQPSMDAVRRISKVPEGDYEVDYPQCRMRVRPTWGSSEALAFRMQMEHVVCCRKVRRRKIVAKPAESAGK